MDDRQEKLSSFYRIINFKLNTCLYPLHECRNKGIRAHTVQNSRVLDLLVSKDNHVYSIESKSTKEHTQKLLYDKISRHDATTFTGLCNEHDSELFNKIDTEDINLKNTKQCFQFAYRAVMKELHSTMSAAYKSQLLYQELEKPKQSIEEPGELGISATMNIINSIESYEYKLEYDYMYEKNDFNNICHYHLTIENQEPSIAVSSMFSVDNILNSKNETLRIVINIFPITTKTTMVLFSWLEHENKASLKKLRPIMEASGDYRKYLLSKLVLHYCDNFVISPDYFYKWSDNKKEKILSFFSESITKDFDNEDPDLFLF